MNVILTIIGAIADVTGLDKLFSGTGRIGEILANRLMRQHYGFASSPLSGAQGVAIRFGNQVVQVAEDDVRYRPVLLPGEVALYDHLGNSFIFKATGNPVLTLVAGLDVLAAGAITITTPTLAVIGDITATGALTADGAITAAGGMVGGLNLTGALDVVGITTLTGSVGITGDLDVTGNAQILGTPTATGNLTAVGTVHGSNI